MGSLIRSHDWNSSSLGSPETWPQNLLVTLSTVLKSKFPMFIWWGDELIQFYNDAYRPSLGNTGKHPTALGQQGEECWPEIWPIIKPLIDQVMGGGDATWSEDQLIPIYRNGRLEDVYWTFSYTPIPSDTGKPGGVLVICHETTEKVQSLLDLKTTEQNLKNSKAEISSQRDRLTRFFMQAPAGVCILDGPELVFELINPPYQELFPGRDLLNKRLLDAVPEIREQPIWEILKSVYSTGETFEGSELLIPLKRTDNGAIEDRYFNFIYQARLDAAGIVDGILVFVIEVTDMVQSRHLVEKHERELVKMLDSIPHMTWTNNKDGEVNFYNERWYDYTGLSYHETKQLGWKAVVHQNELEKTIESYLGILQSGLKGEFENRYQNADGNYRWHLNRLIPIRNEDGSIRIWIGTATDIHDLKQLQQQKDDFVSIASHELKTPITGLKAAMQVISRMKANPKPEMFGPMIDRANRSLDSVINLIEDLLNATKYSKGQLPLNKSRFNLASLVNSCCQHVRLKERYSIEVEGDITIEVDADYERLDQVMINLVNNAVKYAPNSQKIIVTLSRNDYFFRVTVRDYGPGIPPDQLSQLFERYYRAENDGVQASGLGLGLYIASEIIRRHDGQMGVESELGKGSSFWFELPI